MITDKPMIVINGKMHKMADYQGKKVILYFYPKDMTPGCTTQSCDLRDNYESLKADGFEVIGISADDETKHQKFIEKHTLPFNLLASSISFGPGAISIGY